jgi:hypothetical protein
MEMNMNFYFNLVPSGYEDTTDTITVETHPQVMDYLLAHARAISQQKNITEHKSLKEIVNESVNIISGKRYDRKNRKTKNR